MRWSNRLLFALAFFAAVAQARAGASKICVEQSFDGDTAGMTLDRRLLAAAVFSDVPMAVFSEADATPEADLVSILVPTGELEVSAESFAIPHDLLLAVPISVPVLASTRPIAVTTVAVPLPPAAIGGALAAVALLGGPMLSGRRRRRRPARTFR